MTSEIPLYQRDPEAWEAQLAKGNARQPRKRVSADVILRDAAGRILLVDPNYKPNWDTPGGMAEVNEAPHLAAQRELREELGLDIHVGQLLCIDWVAPHGPWDDLIVFIFDGGMLTEQQISTLQPTDDELSAFEFCDEEQAAQRLSSHDWQRTQVALDALAAGHTQYLNDGSALLS